MLLEIKDLSVEYWKGKTIIPALRNVSLNLDAGDALGLVGESGCGKSSLALSILRLIPEKEGKIRSGSITFKDQNLVTLPDHEMRKLRGKEIGMIFQDPFSSLNPVIKIGRQIEEAILAHQNSATAQQLKEKCSTLLRHVRLNDTERFYHSYPHQISGGQRQRVMIAIAIANNPQVLICDEPTTALDVTVQKEILDLLLTLKQELNMAVLLVTHHFGIIANYTKKLAVLYAGEVVEEGSTQEILESPQHPYTQALLKSLPHKINKERLYMIQGVPPNPAELPSGCHFHPRCPYQVEECKLKTPQQKELIEWNRKVSCHLAPIRHEK